VAKNIIDPSQKRGIPKGAELQTDRAFKQIETRYGKSKRITKSKDIYVKLYAKGMNKNLSWKVRGNAMRKLRESVKQYGWNPRGLNAYWKQYRKDYR